MRQAQGIDVAGLLAKIGIDPSKALSMLGGLSGSGGDGGDNSSTTVREG